RGVAVEEVALPERREPARRGAHDGERFLLGVLPLLGDARAERRTVVDDVPRAAARAPRGLERLELVGADRREALREGDEVVRRLRGERVLAEERRAAVLLDLEDADAVLLAERVGDAPLGEDA